MCALLNCKLKKRGSEINTTHLNTDLQPAQVGKNSATTQSVTGPQLHSKQAQNRKDADEMHTGSMPAKIYSL